MASNIIWKNVFLYGVLLAVLIIIACYFMDWLNVKPAINALFAQISMPKIDLTGIFTWITNNGALVGVAASLGTTALAYFIKNYQTNKLLNQATNELTVTQSKLSSATREASNASYLQAQLDELNSDTTLSSLQKSLLNKDSLIKQQETQIQTITAMYSKALDELKTMPKTVEKVVYK